MVFREPLEFMVSETCELPYHCDPDQGAIFAAKLELIKQQARRQVGEELVKALAGSFPWKIQVEEDELNASDGERRRTIYKLRARLVEP